MANDSYGSGGTEYHKCKNKKTNEHGIIEGGVRPDGSRRYDEWVCDRCTKRNFMFKAECRRCKAPPNEAQRNEGKVLEERAGKTPAVDTTTWKDRGGGRGSGGTTGQRDPAAAKAMPNKEKP